MAVIGSVRIPLCERIRRVRHLEKNSQLLKIKKERLYSVRDAMKDEMHRGLMQGKIPTAECRTWFEALEDIEDHVCDIEVEFKLKRRFWRGMCPDLSLHMNLGERVANLIDEISIHLEKSTFEQGLMIDAPPLNITEMITRTTIEEAETISGPVKEACTFAPSREAKAKSSQGTKPPKQGKLKKGIMDSIWRKEQERKKAMLKMKSEASPDQSIDEIIALEMEEKSARRKKNKMVSWPTKVHKKAPAFSTEVEGEAIIETEMDDLINMLSTEDELEPELIPLQRTEALPSETKGEADMVFPPVIKGKRSIDHTLLMVMDAIRDESILKIGIYGIGGVGKTTVLKALYHRPELKYIFDFVICATVSSDWSPKMIRNEVARQLSLHLEHSDTENVTAERLFQLLNSRKFLLLLDDVREQISLDEVGIPNPNIQNGCKIVLTTKSLHVCYSMGTNRQIEMKVISEQESWELVHEKVGENVDSPSIQSFLRDEVTSREPQKEKVRQERGNPSITIHLPDVIGDSIPPSTAHTLSADFSPSGGRAIESILDSRDGGVDEPPAIPASSGSHDNKGEPAGIGRPDRSSEDWTLLDSSLSRLLESPERVLRPFLSYRCLLKSGMKLKQPPKKEEWEQAELIFLMDNEFSSLPENPTCERLLMLFLQRNFRLRTIPASFFNYMFSLLVLDLSGTRIKSLPSSLSKLVSLRALILRDCECLVVLPSQLRDLKVLELLDFQGTGISDLPNEIGELTCLKNLKMSFHGNHDCDDYINLPPELIPPGIISRLLLLKDLSIVVDPEDQRWNKSVQAVAGELANLKELATIDFYFPEVEYLENFLQRSPSWKDECSRKFRFIVGYHVKRFVSRVPLVVELEYEQQHRCLRYVQGEVIPNAIVELLKNSTAFYLDRHQSIHSLSNIEVRNMDKLEFCIIGECHEMQTIVDGAEVTEEGALPMLEHLSVHYLHNLRTIWTGRVPQGSLVRLKSLALHSCPELKYILERRMLQHLPNLEDLIAEGCSSIKDIIRKDRIIEDEIVEVDCVLPRLKSISLYYLPELVSIWERVSICHSLEKITIYACPNLKNIYADSKFATSIKEIRGERDWWNALDWEETALKSRLQRHFIPICHDDLLRRD